nr:MAG TPA: hypothetical protein [Caudoviricetes sp.]
MVGIRAGLDIRPNSLWLESKAFAITARLF